MSARSRTLRPAVMTVAFALVVLIEWTGLYPVVWYADLVAHGAAGVVIGGVMSYRGLMLVWVVGLFVGVVAGGWELLELVLPGFLGMVALGVEDMVTDVVATTVGGVVVAVVAGCPLWGN